MNTKSKIKQLTEEQIKNAVDRYKRGESAKSISFDLPVAEDAVLKLLRLNGVEIRTKIPFSEDVGNNIIKDYLSGLSEDKVSKKYSTSRGKISLFLKRKGVKRRNYSEAVKFVEGYTIDETSFSDPNDPVGAYFYGLILSDGSLNIKKNAISVNLKSSDRHILESLKKYVGSSNKIIECRRSQDGDKEKVTSCIFHFANKVLIERLVSYGLMENKSMKEVCPPFYKYNRHFWRGYMDGDGGIRSRGAYQVRVCGGEDIVEDFISFCGTIGLPRSTYSQKTKNTRIYTGCVNGYKNTKLFLDYIYKDAEVFLYRKYNIYEERYLHAGGK